MSLNSYDPNLPFQPSKSVSEYLKSYSYSDYLRDKNLLENPLTEEKKKLLKEVNDLSEKYGFSKKEAFESLKVFWDSNKVDCSGIENHLKEE